MTNTPSQLNRDLIERIMLYAMALALTVIGYFLSTTLTDINSSLSNHEQRLIEQEKQTSLNTQQDEHLLEIMELKLDDISKNQEAILRRLDQYDERVRAFYEKYELNPKE